MRFDPSALSLLLVVLLGGGAASPPPSSAEAHRRPWGLLGTRPPFPPSRPASTATGTWMDRAAIVPRGGDDSSAAAADVTEAPPPPPPPPPPPVSSETEPAAATAEAEAEGDDDLDDIDARVKSAMRKLGLTDDDGGEAAALEEGGGDAGVECKDGVCELPPSSSSSAAPPAPPAAAAKETDPHSLADRLSSSRSVPRQVVMAAIGASGYSGTEEGEEIDVEAVESVLEGERVLMSGVPEDCDEVKLLTSEGHSVYLTRRALAFADNDVDDARAILVADAEDEEEERRAYEAARKEAEEEAKKRKAEADEAERKRAESEMKTVNVAADFDPTNVGGAGGKTESAAAAMGLQGLMGAQKSSGGTTSQQGGAPKPAKKEDVVFEITEESQIQSLIIESPVPVLLDVYADWCGPCKMLTPALEQMATKAGGLFRLVKLNTDDHRSVSQAMEVQALPTVFGIKDGRVLNSFQGMPRDEDALRNFMMGLLGAGPFDPPLSDAEKKKHADLSIKLLKVAGASSFPFSARERLQGTTKAKLDDLVKERDGNMALGGESASTVRSLLSNVVQNPFEQKFRRVNLDNRVIKARVAAFPQCVSILKSVGFIPDEDSGGGGGNALVLAKGKKAVNLAPLVVARDAIDKWIDRNRYNIAAAARKRNDELERAKLAEETARLQAEAEDEDEYDSDEEEAADPDACAIKVRLEGKKKVHELSMNAEDSLSDLVDALPGAKVEEGEEVRITCAAKRLIVKSTDAVAMGKSLREHGLAPAAAVVVKIGGGGKSSSSGEENGNEGEGGGGSKLAERAAARRNRKRGSQTMQSVGIYSKDDNAKGELIDGGGGVWYEHDVTSDDEEAEDDAAASGKEEEGEEEAEEEGEESDEASDQDEESS